MVLCGSYMHKFSVSKDMKKTNNDKRRKEVVAREGNREGDGTFMSNTNYQRIEN